jgi:cold shock CspA family protein
MYFYNRNHTKPIKKQYKCYIVKIVIRLQSNQMSSEQTQLDNNNTNSSPRIVGQVKWFNNKAGYGFITVSDGEYVGKDIFAHYSTIRVGDTQYRYLVQGEYVEFQLSISTNTAHEYQATHISGIKGGLLMCETRQSSRPVRKEYEVSPATPMPMESSDRVSDRVIFNSTSTRRPPSDRRGRRPDSNSTYASATAKVDSDGFKTVYKKKNIVK